MQTKPFQIPAQDGLPVSLTLRMPHACGKRPLVIVLHGLKGFSNRGGFPYLCERIRESGRAVMSVDFSANGVENCGSEITRVDLAERNSVSREIAECRLIVEAVAGGDVPEADRIDTARITLLGHGLGGAVALLFAEHCPAVAGVVAWGCVSHLDRFSPEDMDRWKRDGRLNRPDARTGRGFYLGADFLRDVLDSERLAPRRAARNFVRPLLLVQGDDDAVVSPGEALRLFDAAHTAMTELVMVPGGTHTFGATHPFRDTTPELEAAIENTIAWLDEVRQ